MKRIVGLTDVYLWLDSTGFYQQNTGYTGEEMYRSLIKNDGTY